MNFKQYIAENKKEPYAVWFFTPGNNSFENNDREYIYIKHANGNYRLTYRKVNDRWTEINDDHTTPYKKLRWDLLTNETVKEFATKQEFEDEWTLENI